VRRGRVPVSTVSLILSGLLVLPPALLPSWFAFNRLSGLLCILSGVLFFSAMRSFTRELSISRRLGLLMVLSGAAWGALVLVSGENINAGGAEGERIRLLRSLNREAVADAAMENARTVQEMISLDIPGPGGAVINSLGDATGATLGAILGTVSGAGAVSARRVEGVTPDTFRGPGGLATLGMLVSLGALLTMLALTEGLVMVDRTETTHTLFWMSVGFVFLHSGLAVMGFDGLINLSIAGNPVSLSFLAVLLVAGITAFCQRWINYLNRGVRLFVMVGALLFAEFSRRVMAVCITEGMPGFCVDSITTIMGTAALFLLVYGFGSFLAILLHMPTARLLDKRYGELNTLSDLSHSLHSSFEPGQLATAATRLGRRLTGADAVWIVPAGPHSGFDGVWCGDGNDFSGEIPGEWYGFLSARLDSTGRGLMFNNYRRTSLERLFGGKGRIGSLMAAQVEVRGEHLGLLLAACSKSFRFVDHTRGLFDSFARQIAQAFHNARLFGEKLELERLQRELDLAREIQRQLFPKEIHQPRGYGIAAANIPCSVVGGDYYDVIPLSRGRTALAIADVAGKGAAASLLMAGLQASLRSLLLSSSSLSELVPLLNRLVCDQVPDGSFITMFLAILDDRDGRLEYCCAGHDPPLLLHADGSMERPDVGGLVLGVDPDARYLCGTTAMRPGSALAAFTDGVTDAFSPTDEEPFGVERLGHVLVSRRGAGPDVFIESVTRLLDAWVGGEAHTDDVTLLAVSRLDDQALALNNKNDS
jgi:serine phosphatase RsbU (regulator of sigma subunit)